MQNQWEGAHLIKSFYDALRLLIKHQDREVERGEFSDTFVERTSVKKKARNGRLIVKGRTIGDTCRMGMLGFGSAAGLLYFPPLFSLEMLSCWRIQITKGRVQ